MKKIFFLLIVLIMYASVGCSSRMAETKELNSALDTLFDSIFEPDGPGGAVIVMQGDSMVYGRGFGLAHLDTKEPVTLNTMFNICSVSKQFSAVALLKLAEQGKLSLDDSILKYFPSLSEAVFRDVRLWHLLSHTSGIPDDRPRTPEEWQKYIKGHKTQYKNVDDFKLYCKEDESLEYLTTLDSLTFSPGSAYEYMNPTYQMVLNIVEQVSGQDFDKWMQQNLFLPAGMKETLYFEEGREIPRMAHGYDRGDNGDWEECDYGEARFFGTKADGGIYTTPLEFVSWNKALFGDKVISTKSRRAAHTGYIDTDIPHTKYGYGWFIENRPGRPEKIYHTGDNGGFLIFEGRVPDRDIFYLIFSTHPQWDREATVEKVDKILLNL